MKVNGLLLCLFISISMNINARHSYEGVKSINLEKYNSNTLPNKGHRSVVPLEVFAYFSFINESVSICFDSEIADSEISIINLSTNEIICSQTKSNPEVLILNLAGLLDEGREYGLQIIIGDTVFYGVFNIQL